MSSGTEHYDKLSVSRPGAKNTALWMNDRLVPLPPQALEVLILLIRRHDPAVSREGLLETVWRDTFVAEATDGEGSENTASPGKTDVILRRCSRACYELSAVVSSGAYAADLTPVK
jgi:hypothetical protein